MRLPAPVPRQLQHSSGLLLPVLRLPFAGPPLPLPAALLPPPADFLPPGVGARPPSPPRAASSPAFEPLRRVHPRGAFVRPPSRLSASPHPQSVTPRYIRW